MGVEVHTTLPSFEANFTMSGVGTQGEGAGPSPLPDLALLSADAGRIAHLAMGRYQKVAVMADGTMLSWQWRGHPEDCSAGQLGRSGPSLSTPTPLNGVLHGLHVRARPSYFRIDLTSSRGSGNQTFAPSFSLPSRLFPLRVMAENSKSTVAIPSTIELLVAMITAAKRRPQLIRSSFGSCQCSFHETMMCSLKEKQRVVSVADSGARVVARSVTLRFRLKVSLTLVRASLTLGP